MRITDLRLFESVELSLESGWNLFVGANGAGKTTILEAAYLLSHGQSFRAGTRDALVREGSEGYTIHSEQRRGRHHRGLAIGRIKGRLEARVGGQPCTVGELMRHSAVLCFEPGSHALLSGGANERRRFLDWGVFHVEPEFLSTWSRYQRALRQRNALLRGGSGEAELPVWNAELARWGEPLSAMRARYFDRFVGQALPLLERLLPELGVPRLSFQSGHDPEQPLAGELVTTLDRDRERGHTTRGPHRADWSLGFAAAPRREHLSRGQEKLAAFALLMAQAFCFRASHGEMPVLCLDDLGSEIDREHLGRVIEMIVACGAQVLATATEWTPDHAGFSGAITRFHVEQAKVQRLL